MNSYIERKWSPDGEKICQCDDVYSESQSGTLGWEQMNTIPVMFEKRTRYGGGSERGTWGM